MNLQEQRMKEDVKNLIFLKWGKHILDAQAKEIVSQYQDALTHHYVSLDEFIDRYYADKYTGKKS